MRSETRLVIAIVAFAATTPGTAFGQTIVPLPLETGKEKGFVITAGTTQYLDPHIKGGNLCALVTNNGPLDMYVPAAGNNAEYNSFFTPNPPVSPATADLWTTTPPLAQKIYYCCAQPAECAANRSDDSAYSPTYPNGNAPDTLNPLPVSPTGTNDPGSYSATCLGTHVQNWYTYNYDANNSPMAPPYPMTSGQPIVASSKLYYHEQNIQWTCTSGVYFGGRWAFSPPDNSLEPDTMVDGQGNAIYDPLTGLDLKDHLHSAANPNCCSNEWATYSYVRDGADNITSYTLVKLVDGCENIYYDGSGYFDVATYGFDPRVITPAQLKAPCATNPDPNPPAPPAFPVDHWP